MKRAGSLAGKGRAALLWSAALFAWSQLVLTVIVERWRPELRDAEYGYKRACLHARLAEDPKRPLVLAVGSSRTLVGLRPELLADCRLPGEKSALVFNFGLPGHGPPLYEFLCLRRLLSEGIHPAWVFLEILPANLQAENLVDGGFLFDSLAWSDLPIVSRYSSRPMQLYSRWCHERLVPWSLYRVSLLNRFARAWATADSPKKSFGRSLSRLGWVSTPAAFTAEEHDRWLKLAKSQYALEFKDFNIAPSEDRALREMLALCRAKGIKTALYTMPEGKVFRSWYPAEANSAVNNYLTRLSQECQVSVFDTRGWMAEEDFMDSHHLRPQSAAVFTERFGREVLQPVLEGKAPRKDESGRLE